MSTPSPEARPARIYRGKWTVILPKEAAGIYRVHDDGLLAFTGTRRELVALRTAITAALLTPKGTP
jgi:hypothetical protein